MRSHKSFVYLLIFCLLAPGLALPVFGQPAVLPPGPTKVTSVEGITEYRLPNGLQVLLIPDLSNKNTMVNVVYRVGSRQEGYGETGMAHLLEHLVFKGTPKYGNIPNEMTKRGMAPNGTTSFDRTNYFATFPNTGDNLEFYLDMEADRMVNSFIAKKDLDSEFSVVRNEFESGENNAQRVLVQKTMATAYQWHNYGKSTIGARSDLENVKIENLQAFYRKFYQPDNATVIVAGNFDISKTLDLIAKKFGSIPKPTRVLEPTWTQDPPQDGEREVIVRRTGDEQLLLVGYHIPSTADSDAPAVAIMDRVLNDNTSGRLQKALVETKKATMLLSGSFQQKEPGYAFFGARLTKEQSIDEARDIIIRTVEEFSAAPPTAEEVERHKRFNLSMYDRFFTDAITVSQLMTDWVARGDWRLFFVYRDRLKTVTPEDVQRVAKAYLLSSNRTVGKFIPTDKPVRAELKRYTDQDIVALGDKVKAGEAAAEGEAFDPTPANIEARTKRSSIGSIKTAILPRQTRGDVVSARLSLRFGDAKSLKGLASTGEMVPMLVMRGTKKRTRQQLRDDLDKIKSAVTVGGDSTGAVVTITSTRANFSEAMRIAAEALREPSFPQDQFDQVKAQGLAQLEAQRSDPQGIANLAIRRVFNAVGRGEVGYVPTIDEDIEEVRAVTPEGVRKFYNDFYGASDAELAIVGDFDEKEIMPLIGQLFGNWKSPKPYIRVPQLFKDVTPANTSFETPDKANAVYLARYVFKMRDDHPDYPALLMANYILGGGFLNSRLATRLRQKDGISYSVGSGFSASAFDDFGSLFVQAILAPENLLRLETAVREEFQKAATEGFTESEIAEAKQGWLLSRQRNRSNDAVIRSSLTQNLVLGRTLAWDAELEKKVESLTAAQINAAAKKYFVLDKFSTVKAGDFARSKGNTNR